MLENAKAILSAAKSMSGDITKFLADIVSIKSLSGNEKEVVERICSEMSLCGFDEVRTDGLGSAIGRIGNGPIKIAIDAHIDTVDVGNPDLWDFDPFEGGIRDGKVWGRGAADQKGGMAAAVYAGRLLKDMDIAKDVTVFVVGSVMEEDCDGLCWRYLIKEEGIKPDICVLTEPTGLNLYRGHRGRMEMEAWVPGISAHGSAPERGENAVYKMAGAVLTVNKLNGELKQDEFLGKGSIVVSSISSEAPSQCSVPDKCSIYLDRRLTAGETKESAVGELEEIIRPLGGEVSVPIYHGVGYTGREYSAEKYFPTWHIPEDHAGVRAGVSAYESLFGSAPRIGKWTFSTNGVAICGVHGIPCVGFGPGYEEQAHAPNEWTPIDHLWKACAFYTAFIPIFASLK